MKFDNCVFCNIKQIKSEILLESDNFYLKIPIGLFTPGHILLISKDHLSCFGNLPLKHINEFGNFKKKAVDLITNKFSKPFLCEQGIHGQSIEHAHIHIIPSIGKKYDLSEGIYGKIFLNLESEKVDDFYEVVDYFNKNDNYVYFEENFKSYIFNTSSRPNLEFKFRSDLARLTGLNNLSLWSNLSEEDILRDKEYIKETKFKLAKVNSNKDYHVILIAAGCSRRLKELTQDKPKCFLEINNKKIINYTLENLDRLGFKKVTFVVGYKKDLVMQTIGNKFGNLDIDYVVSDDYATTGHGYSIYLTRKKWEEEKKSVILIHADIFYDSNILDRVLAYESDVVLAVDDYYKVNYGDEVMVTSNRGYIETIGFINELSKDIEGQLIGINKWSSDFMSGLYNYMDFFFKKNGNNFNWEPIVHNFIKDKGVKINFDRSGGLKWININYKEDYFKARDELFNSIY